MGLSPQDKLTAGNAQTVRHALALQGADPQSDLQALLAHAEGVVPVEPGPSRGKVAEGRRASREARIVEGVQPPLPDFAEGHDQGREARRQEWRRARRRTIEAERRRELGLPPQSQSADPDGPILDVLAKVSAETGQSFMLADTTRSEPLRIVQLKRPSLMRRLRFAWRVLTTKPGQA